MIPLRVHNIVDYLLGAFLIVSPWVFDLAQLPAARALFLLSGITLIAYSLFTNYFFAVARILPLGVHMTIDTILGVVLILAPALLGYRDQLTNAQYVAHIVLGVATVGLVALTRPRTEAHKSAIDRAAINRDLPITPRT